MVRFRAGTISAPVHLTYFYAFYQIRFYCCLLCSFIFIIVVDPNLHCAKNASKFAFIEGKVKINNQYKSKLNWCFSANNALTDHEISSWPDHCITVARNLPRLIWHV